MGAFYPVLRPANYPQGRGTRPVVGDGLDQLVELGVERIRLLRHVPQFLHEGFHGCVVGQPVFDQLWSLLGLCMHHRVKNMFCQLRVGFQLDKDVCCQRPLHGAVWGGFIVREQVFDPLMIGFSHGNGIRGLCVVVPT